MGRIFIYRQLHKALLSAAVGVVVSQPAWAINVPAMTANGPFVVPINQVATPAAVQPSTATVAGTVTGVNGGSPGTPIPCAGIPCNIGPDDGAIDQSTQSMNQPPFDGNSAGGGDLFGGDSGSNLGGLSAEQLGALSPAAGGGLAASDSEAIDCLNAYLKNGWNTAELKDKCGGGNTDTL